jgi:small subunit ribosomal protein S5
MDTPKPTTQSSSTGAARRPFVPRPGQSRGPGGPGGQRSGGGKPGGDRRRPSFERPKPEFDQKILAIRRVTRVVSGGRRMSFAVAIAIGDKKGSVGVGTGKAGDTSLAINKAVRSARKNMIKIKTTKNGAIPHEVHAKYSSASIMIMPNRGKGIVTGSAVRDILNLAGINNITSKVHSGSKNKLNIARATIKALSQVGTKRIHDVKPVAVAMPVAVKE